MKTLLLFVIAALLAVYIVPRTQFVQDVQTMRAARDIAAANDLPAPANMDDARALVVFDATRDVDALPVAYVMRAAEFVP